MAFSHFTSMLRNKQCQFVVPTHKIKLQFRALLNSRSTQNEHNIYLPACEKNSNEKHQEKQKIKNIYLADKKFV